MIENIKMPSLQLLVQQLQTSIIWLELDYDFFVLLPRKISSTIPNSLASSAIIQ